MDIWIIGYFVMLGYLIISDNQDEFTGFKGILLLIALCLLWPLVLGGLLAEMEADKAKDQSNKEG